MPALPLFEAVLASIFGKISPLCKRQRLVLSQLFCLILLRQGRANFANLARFSTLHEHTLRRHFSRSFNWLGVNLVVLRLHAHPRETLVGVFDATFLPKSGTKTWGLGRFFCSAVGAARLGLEASLIGVVAVESRRAFGLGIAQTPSDLGSSAGAGADKTRMDFYLAQVLGLLPHLPQVRYWIGDGGYARRKFFGAITARGKHFITRLRSDANLRYLFDGARSSGPGRPRLYNGKVEFADLSRFECVGALDDQSHVLLYHAVVNSPHFGHDLGVVVLVNERTGGHVVLCSTDVEQIPEEIVSFYRLRYQIEFVIRDAKQHAGLTECQARDQVKLAFHLNLSVAAVGVMRLAGARAGVSLASLRREAYNALVVGRVLEQLGLQAQYDLLSASLRSVLLLGSMRRSRSAAPV
jgi:hypothetical protein